MKQLMHLEVHVVNDAHGATLLEEAGMPEMASADIQCSNCLAEIGYTSTGFTPLTVVLDDEDTWFTCLNCASSLVFPQGV